MEIANITSNAFDEYFSALRKYGLVSDKERKNLLVLSFLNWFIHSDYLHLITNSDLKSIYNLLTCLENLSCYVNLPVNVNTPILSNKIVKIRVAENLSVLTQDNQIKILN